MAPHCPQGQEQALNCYSTPAIRNVPHPVPATLNSLFSIRFSLPGTLSCHCASAKLLLTQQDPSQMPPPPGRLRQCFQAGSEAASSPIALFMQKSPCDETRGCPEDQALSGPARLLQLAVKPTLWSCRECNSHSGPEKPPQGMAQC